MDYEAGALSSFHDLVQAEVFDDFLSMAEYLIETGYKNPAAVLAGGVLEGELRKLATRASIATLDSDGRPVKSERLNAELAKVGIYKKLDQKSVTSWLALRNMAAHGHYDEYSPEQLQVMLSGVRDFVSRMTAP